MRIESILRGSRPVMLVLFLVTCGPGRRADEPPAPSEPRIAREESESQPPVPPYEVIGTEDAGALRGRIRLGRRRSLDPIPVDKDVDVCGTDDPRLPLRVGSGEPLPNSVVWLEDVTRGKAMPPDDETVLIGVEGCAVHPRVRLAAVGARLLLVNGDDLFHDIRATSESGESVFRHPLPMQDFRAEETLSKPGIIRLRCEAGHPWMAAYIVAHAHPYYALTDEEGYFAIDEIPAGEYRLMVWHELTEGGEKSVTVEPGESSEIELTLDMAEEWDNGAEKVPQ